MYKRVLLYSCSDEVIVKLKNEVNADIVEINLISLQIFSSYTFSSLFINLNVPQMT